MFVPCHRAKQPHISDAVVCSQLIGMALKDIYVFLPSLHGLNLFQVFFLLFLPIDVGELLLDVHLFELEVLAEEAPRHVEHLLGVEIDVDGKKLA